MLLIVLNTNLLYKFKESPTFTNIYQHMRWKDLKYLYLCFLTDNLTPFGTATQSSQVSIAGPKNAINLPITNKFEYNHCTHTYPSTTNKDAWWMFEFFKSSYVTEITIYYRNRKYARKYIITCMRVVWQINRVYSKFLQNCHSFLIIFFN